jgi:hypothetical protein
MTLGELRLGDVFRTTDGRVGVRWRWEAGNRQDRRLGCLWLDGHGFNTTLPVNTPVERLDLPALLEEHALFRRLLEDVGQDQGYSVGVWAERGEVVRMLERGRDHHAPNGNFRRALEAALIAIRARGPAATLPEQPARLAERVRELEEALRRLLDDTHNASFDRHADDLEFRKACAAAHAALGME